MVFGGVLMTLLSGVVFLHQRSRGCMFDPRILCVVLRYREGIISWALELYGRLSHVEPTQDFCVCVSFTFHPLTLPLVIVLVVVLLDALGVLPPNRRRRIVHRERPVRWAVTISCVPH